MKIIYLFIFLGLSLFSKAQSYLNRRYDHNSISLENGWSVYVDSQRYYVSISTKWNAGPGYLISAGMIQVDLTGNLLDYDLYNDSGYHSYPGGSTSLNRVDNGFILGGSIVDTVTSDACLFRLNNQGDRLWEKRYGDTAFQSGWQAKPTPDGGFALCGQDATDGTYGGCQMMLIKTDSSGNLQWQRNYGDSIEIELAYAFITTADGGFAVAGERRYSNSNDMDIYLVKTDSAGNVEWEKQMGGYYADRLYNIISCMDGNFVVVGQYGEFNSLDWPFISKFDLQGNLLWENHSGMVGSSAYFYSVKELSDGSFIAVGDADDYGVSLSAGIMVKIASNGDSLWYYKYHSTIPPLPITLNILKDVYPTSDGGFVACGYVDPNPPDTGNQDIWILKVDSNGCEVANCTVGVNEVVGRENERVKIYPNPFENNLQIDLKEIKNNCKAQIIDMTGKRVKEFSLQNPTTTLNTEELSVGIYLIRVSENGNVIYSGKICRF